ADTLVFTYEGFQKEEIVVKSDKYLTLYLKHLPSIVSSIKKSRLASLTKDLSRENQKKWYSGDETYASIVENNFVDAKHYPTTGIALNIDRASYSNVRRFINLNLAVPPDAVRIEEMLNYFNFGYESPNDKSLFKIKTTLTNCPWNKDNQLFFINVFSKKLDLDSLPPSNLVFLVDISGSMDMPNRLPLLKSAFKMLTMNLREKDTVSIVVYGGAVGVLLFPTAGNEKERINKAIDEMQPGGSTPGESGIKLAYMIAKKHFIEKGNNRVILATDGDFNVGIKTEQELDELISRHRESGIYLTCLGVGMGNYKDSKIQTLARKGNGNFAYVDNYQEAEKIIMKEFTQTLYTIADDAHLQVTFDPSLVKQYRLIGFDNKVGALADSTSEIEGGEIGSGQSLTAAFEIEPNFEAGAHVFSNKYVEVRLEHRLPMQETQQQVTESFAYNPIPYKDVDPIFRFASSVIMFGSVLKSSSFAKDIGWGDVLFHASEAANPTDINQAQFVELVYKAKEFNTKKKKKNRN
ncbi:MAG TPA: von Willebrand factor type A domain-containing protein, partial [Chitinophagaceae bacterium]|nr:von Willebrand factor type A domain-containing protein [Chitinophagaceae bacterium]